LGAGGEGTVYSLEGHSDICVKLYHKDKINTTLENKLKAMLAHPPLDPTLSFGHYSICWPTHLVYASEDCTKFLGFAMPLIDKNVFKEYHLLCDKPGSSSSVCYRLENFGTGFTYLHMYAVALNLVTCVMNIHKAGHAIGDLNDKNILVSTKDSKLTVVDCDSFEIREADTIRYDCNVYMPEFSAPEVIKREKIDDRQLSDRFSLAILIFKLLMLNTHPYASRGSSVEHLNTPEEKIMSGYYPYKEYENLDVRPPVYALPYYIIPPEISKLFDCCFVEGQNNPEKRPTPEEWFTALKVNYDAMYAYYKKNKTMCSENMLHVFPRHLEECPWCEMKDDYFPPKPVPSSVKNKIPEEVIENLAYIEDLITKFAEDSQITVKEYKQLLLNAARKNFPKTYVDKSIHIFAQKQASCIMGEEPTLSEMNVYLGEISADNDILSKIIKIKNNYLFDEIRVELKSKNSELQITPKNAIIKPGEKLNVLIETVIKQSNLELYGRVDDIVEIEYVRKDKIFKTKLSINVAYDQEKYISQYQRSICKILKKPLTIIFIALFFMFSVSLLSYMVFNTKNQVEGNKFMILAALDAITAIIVSLFKPNKKFNIMFYNVLMIIVPLIALYVMISSNGFFLEKNSYLLIFIVLLQSVLYALIFSFNMIFDEKYERISEFYSHYILIVALPLMYLIASLIF